MKATPAMSGSLRPYRQLACIYDELVGYSAFICWKENFHRLVGRYSIEFETVGDIACGTGLATRHLAGLCRRVYAVDESGYMLEVAMRRPCGGNVVFLEQSFTRLKLPGQVDLIT